MNWGEIGTQIILSVIGAIASGLGVLITYLINKYVKNEQLKAILNSLRELVRNSVLETQQTYVDAIKKSGMFDKEAQEEALAKCLSLIKSNMPKEIEKWLADNYKDVEAYLKSLIESSIGALKVGK